MARDATSSSSAPRSTTSSTAIREPLAHARAGSRRGPSSFPTRPPARAATAALAPLFALRAEPRRPRRGPRRGARSARRRSRRCAEDARDAATWAVAVADGDPRGARPRASSCSRGCGSTPTSRARCGSTPTSRMLYDEQRELFSIGYNLAEGRLDPSLLRPARERVPARELPRHRQGRRAAGALVPARPRRSPRRGDGRALVSWSASMFEYLMPLLVMRDWPGTLLDETYDDGRARARSQYGARARRAVGRLGVARSTPRTPTLTYQYQAFGVPGLGLKRGLSDDVVVAPYASRARAAGRPARGRRQPRAPSPQQGGEGRYGYYEAVDYTPGRVPAGTDARGREGVLRAPPGHGVRRARQRAARRPACSDRFHADPMVALGGAAAAGARAAARPARARRTSRRSSYVRSVRELPAAGHALLPARPTRPCPRRTSCPTAATRSWSRTAAAATPAGEGIAVTRYREDVTRDCWGTFFYVRDVETRRGLLGAAQPVRRTSPTTTTSVFAPDKAEYRRRDGDLETHVEVVVSPEDDVEVRRLTITNHGRATRDARGHLATSRSRSPTQAADQAHRSFSNLFVETEAAARDQRACSSRGGRAAPTSSASGASTCSRASQEPCDWSCETDRAAFLGRLRGADRPDGASSDGGPLGRHGRAGARPVLRDPPHGRDRARARRVRLVFATGVADDARRRRCASPRSTATPRSAQRAIDLAWTATQLELRDLGITPDEAVALERLASRLLLTDPYSPLKVKTPVENGLPISGLWSIGISGDLPDPARARRGARARAARAAGAARAPVLAAQGARRRPRHPQHAADRLRRRARRPAAAARAHRPRAAAARQARRRLPAPRRPDASRRRATCCVSRRARDARGRRRAASSCSSTAAASARRRPTRFVPDARAGARTRQPRSSGPTLAFDNGLGGFDPETGEYVIVLEDDATTPAPWINVMANPEFGCIVSEAGVGCTWALNSHENRITTWNNDPVSDGSRRGALHPRRGDRRVLEPDAAAGPHAEPYVVRHGRGYVTLRARRRTASRHELDWFVPADDPVRVVRLRLTNDTDRPRQALGHAVRRVGRSATRAVAAQQRVVTWFDAETEMLTAHNHFNLDFPGRCAFLACDRPLHSWTASRTEFVGRNGRPGDPAAMHRKRPRRHHRAATTTTAARS